jgi:hypothetical protein
VSEKLSIARMYGPALIEEILFIRCDLPRICTKTHHLEQRLLFSPVPCILYFMSAGSLHWCQASFRTSEFRLTRIPVIGEQEQNAVMPGNGVVTRGGGGTFCRVFRTKLVQSDRTNAAISASVYSCIWAVCRSVDCCCGACYYPKLVILIKSG